jgi:hypothetical protein
MGVGIGNTPIIAAKLAAKGITFGDGSALFGNASLALTNFCRSHNLEWSIQDGSLQFLELGGALETMGVVLTDDAGTLESATIDHKGLVTAQARIQPGIAPGQYVQLKSLSFSGIFRVLTAEFTGDTRGDDWQVRFTAKAPKSIKV